MERTYYWNDDHSDKTHYILQTVGELNAISRDIRKDKNNWFDKVMNLVDAYYALEGNICGGNLHIVLDDENLEDNHLQWCAGLAYGRGDHQAMDIVHLMLFMTMKQRKKVYKGR